MNKPDDISKALLSEETIRQRVPSLFQDSIITNSHLMISMVSQNMLDLLEFKLDDLKGKPLAYLMDDASVIDLKGGLDQNGYFDERKIIVVSKGGRKFVLAISGFNLGLISEINGRIFFHMRCLEKTETLKKIAQERKSELDNFIYRAGHDLRGPLATIKGLVNLLKIRSSNDEVDRLVQLIDVHTNTLDERLFQLIYTTQTESEVDSSADLHSTTVIETRLRKIIEKNAFVDFLELHFTSHEMCLKGFNPFLFTGMLENLLLYVLALQMNSKHSQIFFWIDSRPNGVLTTVELVGFEMSETVIEALKLPDFNYTDLVKFPHMINFYTAQRKADQLQGKIRATILSANSQRIEAFVPTFH